MTFLLLLLAILLVVFIGFYFSKKGGQAGGSVTRSALENVKLTDTHTTKALRKQMSQTPAKAFKKEMRMLDSQCERMNSKLDTLDRSLKEYFGDSVISYQKFAGTIEAVEDVFAENSKKILKRIDVFDEEGYNDLFRRHLEYTDAIQPYLKHFNYIQERLQENEHILSQMDRLMLEVNNLNESQTPIDQLPALQEINDLIEQTKLYQQH